MQPIQNVNAQTYSGLTPATWTIGTSGTTQFTGTPIPWTGAWQGAVDNADTLRLNFLLNMINKHGTEGLAKRVNWDPTGIDRKSLDQAMEAGTL